MEQTKLSQQEFANKTGISAPSLSSIFTGRTNPTNKHVKAIHQAFPDININWLLFGEGEPRVSASAAQGDEEGMLAIDMVGNDSPGDMFSPHSAASLNGEASATADAPSVAAQKRLEKKLLEKLLEEKAAAPDVVRRKITEIRVFFDDGTYETFSPGSK